MNKKGNPHLKPPIGNKNARKGDANLIPYNVRIDSATVSLIKQYKAMHNIASQGEVITMAINLLMGESNMVKINTTVKRDSGVISANREIIQLNGATLATQKQNATANDFASAWANLAEQTLNLGYGSPKIKPDALNKITEALNEGKTVNISGNNFTIE